MEWRTGDGGNEGNLDGLLMRLACKKLFVGSVQLQQLPALLHQRHCIACSFRHVKHLVVLSMSQVSYMTIENATLLVFSNRAHLHCN